MIKSKFSQKGVSLFLAIIILAIILAIVLGLTAILVSQIKIIRGMEYSVVALYAADTGIEEVLYYRFRVGSTVSFYPNPDIGNGSSYEAKVYCCSETGEAGAACEFDVSDNRCPLDSHPENPDPIADDCKATRFCVRSVGEFKETKRAIEVKIYPIITP